MDKQETGQFLSTPSARRATLEALRVILGVEISIHALREEGDRAPYTRPSSPSSFLSTPSARRATPVPFAKFIFERFLSTPSARRATAPGWDAWGDELISIHALREEGDYFTVLVM